MSGLGNACELDASGESMDVDGRLIVDAVLMANTFCSAPNCSPREVVSVSDDELSLISRVCVCHRCLWLWFILLAVFVNGISW